MRFKRLLVTGGAGFIGSAFIRMGLLQNRCEKIVNLDLLTYAACLQNLASVESDARYHFVRGDICNEQLVRQLCEEHQIEAIVNFAAETHVDRSIAAPRPFYETNVGGVVSLLEVVRNLPHIHLHQVSTDEVYGSIEKGFFSEGSPHLPNSPYAASKAAGDHFVRAYTHTYGLSTTLSHCSNNYGPGQHKEKLIPLMITRCLAEAPLPIYGTGSNRRDWLYVDDHVEALWLILERGKRGEIYDIGGGAERSNLEIVSLLIEELAAYMGKSPEHYRALISFVSDRPGHDFRYAIDSAKIQKELLWRPRHSLEQGIQQTIRHLCLVQNASPASSPRA